jgi:hypothetical protein
VGDCHAPPVHLETRGDIRTTLKGVVMKNLLFLLVALTPTPSSAREAILDVFSPEAKPDFAVLAPQLRAAADLEQSVEPPPAPVDAFSPELNGDFELIPHSFTINPYPARPAVPSWMRAGASFMGPASSPFRPSQDDAFCQSRSFFPRYEGIAWEVRQATLRTNNTGTACKGITCGGR